MYKPTSSFIGLIKCEVIVYLEETKKANKTMNGLFSHKSCVYDGTDLIYSIGKMIDYKVQCKKTKHFLISYCT